MSLYREREINRRTGDEEERSEVEEERDVGEEAKKGSGCNLVVRGNEKG